MGSGSIVINLIRADVKEDVVHACTGAVLTTCDGIKIDLFIQHICLRFPVAIHHRVQSVEYTLIRGAF